jgi:hypothetical protein
MSDSDARQRPLPRILIVHNRRGEFCGAYCDGVDEPVEIAIAAMRLDGRLTGRPTPSLATVDPELVARAFALIDAAISVETVELDIPGLAQPDEDTADSE